MQKKRAKIDFWFDHFEMELEAHIWCVSSTDETYSHTKYELLTPSGDSRTRISFFARGKLSKGFDTLKKYTAIYIGAFFFRVQKKLFFSGQ